MPNGTAETVPAVLLDPALISVYSCVVYISVYSGVVYSSVYSGIVVCTVV